MFDPQHTDPPQPDQEQPAQVHEVTHSRPTLTYGSKGDDVFDLVALLAKAGYNSNEIAQGTNTVGYLDQSVMADVRAFARDHDVSEAVEGYQGREGGDAHRNVDHHVGPEIWQALLDATA
jgi:peptidoglycan hydrolase-like protein with peptidoglycan-binding domain